MRLGLILICFLALTAPAAAREETGDTQELTVVYRPLARTGCNLRTARRADFAAVAADPEARTARCVRLKGILVGRFFFADLDAYTRAGGRIPWSWLEGDTQPAMLGLYGNVEVMNNLPTRPVRAEIAGRAGDCETLGRGAFMVMGYCHYTGGGYLAVTEMDLGEPFVPPRFVSDADRSRIGDLTPLPSDDPLASMTHPRVREWLETIHGGKLRRLAELEGRLPEEADPVKYRPTVDPYADRAWSWLRKLPVTAPVQVFRQRSDSEDYFLFACVCRLASCDGLWPITGYDAGMNPARPYACLEFMRLKRQTVWETEADFDGRRLREPPRPRS